MGLGHTLEVAHQEIVQPLPRILLVHQKRFGPAHRIRRIGPYNEFH
jgi:hypothetical protein